MEKWSVYEKMGVEIHQITRFVGGEREVAIHFNDPAGKRYRLYFDRTPDFRYAIEEAFIATVYRMPKELRTPDRPSILMVTGSAYLKHFEEEAGGTRPLEGLVHYLIIDLIGTGVELLSYAEPVLTKVDYDIYEETDRYITRSDQQDAGSCPTAGVRSTSMTSPCSRTLMGLPRLRRPVPSRTQRADNPQYIQRAVHQWGQTGHRQRSDGVLLVE